MHRIVFGIVLGLLAPGTLLAEAPALHSGEGLRLAATHCASCHTLPAPSSLTQESWKFSLAYMGLFLGFHSEAAFAGFTDEERDILTARRDFVTTANLLPERPVISEPEWRTLQDYYLQQAPTVPVPQTEHPAPREMVAAFSVMPTQYQRPRALTSLVKIDETRRQLMIHDGMAEELTLLDRTGDIIATHASPGVVLVDTELRGNDVYLLSIGDLFASRIGEGFGELQRARLVGSQLYGLEVLLKDLHRSTALTLTDLDGDGFEDALISNFGDYTGNLSLFRGTPNGSGFSTVPDVLSIEPGIVQAKNADFNGDGRTDIAVLASHAFENLSIHLQNPDGTFTREPILSQPPSFGYTGLLLRDFDADGRMDLITLNGDNGDSDPYNTLKAHHGIRIYFNRGELRFEEAFFYPMHGVFGAEIEDFDGDGDLDIAAVAFHPDFGESPRENFVLLLQSSVLEFDPITHPATYPGRWMTIDSGDLDGDGDPDLVLGAGYSPVGLRFKHHELLKKMMENGPALLVLKNHLASPTD